jgi:hypothetical protein
MNQSLYLPIDEIQNRKSLFDVMRTAILEDFSLTAYGLGPTQEDDEFRYPLTAEDVDSLLNPVRLRYVENLDTGEKEPVESKEPYASDDVVAYKIIIQENRFPIFSELYLICVCNTSLQTKPRS